ncbi:adenylate/guanylate cyclase domain-containing protein [Cyanobium sp. FGCU-6]|nr:adenylate/guanylate cyclase domain-containing protein [Cyanobium sp. FGCU6]
MDAGSIPGPWPARLRWALDQGRRVAHRGAPYAVAGLMLLGLQRLPLTETLDLLWYDLITTLRPAPGGKEHPIALVGIDEGDIGAFGWPIDDAILCKAIDRITAAGATAVGLDIYRDRGVGPNQDCLRQRFRNDPRLISINNVAEGIGPVPGTPPQRQGFNDLVVDPDGVVRRDLVHVSGQDAATVSFPLRVLEVGKGALWMRQQLEKGTAPGPWLEPTSGGYQRLDAAGYQQMLVFDRPGSFPLWNLRQVLAERPLPASAFRGRMVLIGSTAPSLRDLFPVPRTRFATDSSLMLIPGVEIHAQRLAALLDRYEGDHSRRIRTLPGWSDAVLELLAAALGLGLGEAFRQLRRSVIAVGLVAVLLVGGSVALLLANVWIGLAMPLAALVVMAGAAWLRRGAASQEQQQQIERLLGQTTSPAVARALWDQREQLLSDGRFEGRQLMVTVLMSDTCNFTTVSERLDPRSLLAWLNQGMSRFVPAITTRGGMVNKFTGDGLLAVFGAPLSDGPEADALAAVEAALAIQSEVEVLNDGLAERGEPAMHLRIGLHSGDVLAGSIGSSERLEYAVIGDAVNCASRLESVEKERQRNRCRVLVSADTRSLLPPDLALRWEGWGRISLKGRQEPLEVWELLGPAVISPDSAPAAVPASPTSARP